MPEQLLYVCQDFAWWRTMDSPTSSGRILSQWRIDGGGGEVDVANDASSDENILDRALQYDDLRQRLIPLQQWIFRSAIQGGGI